jgi:hypothetical protein
MSHEPTQLLSTQGVVKLCACGCGKPVTSPENRFLAGHHRILRAKSKTKTLIANHVKGSDDALVQNMELAQQIIDRTLHGAKGQNTINIITVGPIRIESSGVQGNNGTEPSSLDGLMSTKYGLLDSSLSVDSKIKWLTAAERALIVGQAG